MAEMKETVATIAAQLGLPEGLLCARRHLETLLTDRAWPSALEGWRRPLLHDSLIAMIP
jgi:ribonuclease D